MTVFLRIIETSISDKPEALRRAIASLNASGDPHPMVFEGVPEAFAAVPGSPFAYWVSGTVRAVFKRFASFELEGRIALGGLKTLSDERFVRAWWELYERGIERWPALAKGGAYSRFYVSTYLRVNWSSEGDDISWYGYQRRPREGFGAASRGIEAYFRPGITWPRRTDGVSFRVLPAGCIFGDKGPAAFVREDSPQALLALSALMNSAVFSYLISVQLARTELAQSYEVGLIQQTPVPNLSEHDTAELARLARRSWSLKRSLDTSNETSHAFLLPPGVNKRRTSLDADAVERELASIQRQIDELTFALYGIGPEDRAAIEASSTRATSSDAAADDDEEAEEDSVEEEAPVGASADALVSWLVGVTFARFDPRLATGERPIPSEPDPFDPLPLRSPGMYAEGDEPVSRSDILVDDEGHADDLAARVRAVAERVHVDVPEKLRGWLAKELFPLHIKMYSKSRRKAPIYWQLATPSASYSVWLHIHAFSKDTLFRVQNDYAAPKLAHEERRLGSLTSELRDGATAAQRKQLAAQEALVEELRAFLDEVKRVAPLWKPNLDDGVVVNFAPLWRLVPQNKSWQKELKATWDVLCEGKYDWAQLAMHLWPERVVSKCAKDRSLAIAHGLGDVFWVEGSDGKWTARKTPTHNIDELVRERASPAVKSALKSLLEAPVTTGNAGRGRRTTAADVGDA